MFPLNVAEVLSEDRSAAVVVKRSPCLPAVLEKTLMMSSASQQTEGVVDVALPRLDFTETLLVDATIEVRASSSGSGPGCSPGSLLQETASAARTNAAENFHNLLNILKRMYVVLIGYPYKNNELITI